MAEVIKLTNVSKVFNKNKAVDQLSFSIEKGSVVALLGSNGAGKSTTISMILGLLQPTAGEVKLLGGHPGDLRVRDRIGAMLQEVSVIDSLKVGEILQLFRSYYENPLPLDYLLQAANLTEEKNKIATSLSGGQQRRLGFAIALAGDPEILFLDEPTVGMDVTSRHLFWTAVRDMAAKGRTIILTTHYLEEADSVADRIIVIDRGRLIADGTPNEIKAKATGRQISFTPHGDKDALEKQLQGMTGISRIEWNGQRIKLFSSDTDRLICELIQQRIQMKEIEIAAGGLEEAFQTLIQQ
ncbi:ABC transporter ATP-binding protein [Paenibacillus sp. GCM10027626]|uniref:ABC transporter ATP-binding protein n=1 Tax=Paenibacillus sp. GCM10027626 TaxID=3273411 RepID=UPI003632CF04